VEFQLFSANRILTSYKLIRLVPSYSLGQITTRGHHPRLDLNGMSQSCVSLALGVLQSLAQPLVRACSVEMLLASVGILAICCSLELFCTLEHPHQMFSQFVQFLTVS
jgi:hypothetical protein